MAFRKEKIKEQYNEALPSVLEPGEVVEAGSYTVSGPSPWLVSGIGFLIAYLMGMRNYFVAVTPRRVIFMKGSFWTGRPTGLAWVDPRTDVSVTEVKDKKVWSSLRFQRPGQQKPIRLNFHAWWKDEFRGIATALSGSAATPPPPASPAPPPPAPPQA